MGNMSETGVTLADVLKAVRALETKIDVLFKRQVSPVPTPERPDEVTLAELIPLMPKGLRSRSSVQRLLTAGAITGRKVRGTWTFKPERVFADLDHFERVSSVALALNPRPRRKRPNQR